MKNIEKIGFIFTNKEVIYSHKDLSITMDMLYKSTHLVNTTDTNQKKEDTMNV